MICDKQEKICTRKSNSQDLNLDCQDIQRLSVCPSCLARDLILLYHEQCDVGLNNEKCCFDAGDCDNAIPINQGVYNDFTTWPSLLLCPTCESMVFIGDDVCQADLNDLSCCFDGLDCEIEDLKKPKDTSCGSCKSLSLSLSSSTIGDGFCDKGLNTPECCLDGGDCSMITPMHSLCSTCNTTKASAR